MPENADELKEKVQFYWFWAWEYTKRNAKFRKMVDEWHVAFSESSILGPNDEPNLNEPKYGAEQFAKFESIDMDMRDGKGSDDLTPEQHAAYIRRMSLEDRIYEEFGYDIRVFTGFNLTSAQIVEKLANGEELPRPHSGRWRFTEMIVVKQREEDYDGGKHVVFEGRRLEGFDALVAVDFSKDLETLTLELARAKQWHEWAMNGCKGSWGEYDEFEHYARLIQKGSRRFSFKPEDEPRVAGIWLWDHLTECHGDDWPPGAIKEAMNEFEERYSSLKMVSEANVWRRIIRNTKKCIEEAEVLPLN